MAEPKLTMADILKTSVSNFEHMVAKKTYERYSSGNPYIDRIFSGDVYGGAMPIGGVIEVSGPFSSGKTTLCLTTCRRVLDACQPHEGIVFFDYENSVDKRYAKRAFGLNLDNSDPRVVYLQPLSIEDARKALAKFFQLAESAGYCPIRLVVFDSVAAMNPAKFLQGAIDGESAKDIGLQARELSRLFAEFVGLFRRYNITMMFTNQLRSNIKLSQYDPGPLEDTVGGNAIKFYSWIRCTLKPKGVIQVKTWDPVTGTTQERELFRVIRVSTIKNKTAPPYLEDEVHIRFGYGFDNAMTTVLKATTYGLFHPDSKDNATDRERYKCCYITGDGRNGWNLWKYQVDPNNPFNVAVMEQKLSNGKRKPIYTSLLHAPTLVKMSELLTLKENKPIWDYLISEVLRHYTRDQDLYMSPEERQQAHAEVLDSAELIDSSRDSVVGDSKVVDGVKILNQPPVPEGESTEEYVPEKKEAEPGTENNKEDKSLNVEDLSE